MTIDFKSNKIYHFDKELNKIEHKPFSTEFVEIEVLPNGKILVLENYYQYDNHGRSNLYCINQNMEIEWFLPQPYETPWPMDNYVGFTTNGDSVFAHTPSCYRIEIDTEKGQIKNIKFTK